MQLKSSAVGEIAILIEWKNCCSMKIFALIIFIGGMRKAQTYCVIWRQFHELVWSFAAECKQKVEAIEKKV